ncbi:hypothetical protein [Aquimarina sp. RZ0]|uniref:hypothetical protein n=1 Tax=Aquimarina sp. RZ0 TaxID=2607730 RepID=UPI0011F0EB57|nr:hypothetical protein [Aquimarina sp. RZ0]KAA1243875.1 hypothetical protein F0000_19055 [Aquimarina sp. RZ0]
MKKLIVLLAIVFLGTVQIFANDKNTPENAQQKLRKEIITLLDKPQIVVEQAIKANIEFMLNAKNEIVILTVDSDKELIENYVKTRLNYKKINFEGSGTGNTIFNITLKVVKPAI